MPMLTVLLAVVVFLLVASSMAVGLMVSGKRLRGSCGGSGSPDCACDAKGIAPPADCPRRQHDHPLDEPRPSRPTLRVVD